MIGRLLCRLGFHAWVWHWVSDGKGNQGDYAECARCGKTAYDDRP